jgi:hypothetical protein
VRLRPRFVCAFPGEGAAPSAPRWRESRRFRGGRLTLPGSPYVAPSRCMEAPLCRRHACDEIEAWMWRRLLCTLTRRRRIGALPAAHGMRSASATERVRPARCLECRPRKQSTVWPRRDGAAPSRSCNDLASQHENQSMLTLPPGLLGRDIDLGRVDVTAEELRRYAVAIGDDALAAGPAALRRSGSRSPCAVARCRTSNSPPTPSVCTEAHDHPARSADRAGRVPRERAHRRRL